MTLKKEGIVSGCATRAKLNRPSEPDETAAVWLCCALFSEISTDKRASVDQTGAFRTSCPLVRESTVKEILNDQVRSILALPNEAFVKARAPLALGFGVSKAWTGA
jgi:hypothetical protein